MSGSFEQQFNAWRETMTASLGGTLGIEIERLDKECVVMTMPVGPRVHQPFGVLHGGASVALAESAASVGANLNCPDGMAAVGQAINANHLRPMSEGLLRATAVPLHRGRTSQVWSIDLRDGDGNLICVSRCTLAIVPASRSGPIAGADDGA